MANHMDTPLGDLINIDYLNHKEQENENNQNDNQNDNQNGSQHYDDKNNNQKAKPIIQQYGELDHIESVFELKNDEKYSDNGIYLN